MKSKINKQVLLVGFILLIGAILRLYDLPSVAQFEYDDQYNSYLVYNLVKNHHFSLVGQEMSFGGMFLGPWHYLYLTPFYLITKLHPLGGYLGEISIGLLTVFSYYWVGKRLFSTKTALLAGILRAVIYSFTIQDRNIGPAYPGELVTVWFLYFLIELYKGRSSVLPVLAFLFGMMFTTHLSVLPLVVVWILMMVVHEKSRSFLNLSISQKVRLGALSLFGFLLPVFPLLLFEVKNHFAHVSRFITTVTSEGYTEKTSFISKLFSEVSYISESFYHIFEPSILPALLGVVILIAIIWQVLKMAGEFQHKWSRWLFMEVMIIEVIYYLIYPRHVPEYYYIALTPLIVWYTSAFMVNLSRQLLGKIIVGTFLFLIILSNGQQYYLSWTNTHSTSLMQKDDAVKSIVDHQKNKGPFSVSYLMDYGRQYGFQYFFTYYGLEPRLSIERPIYSLVIPRNWVSEKDLSGIYGDIGVIYPEKEYSQRQ